MLPKEEISFPNMKCLYQNHGNDVKANVSRKHFMIIATRKPERGFGKILQKVGSYVVSVFQLLAARLSVNMLTVQLSTPKLLLFLLILPPLPGSALL